MGNISPMLITLVVVGVMALGIAASTFASMLRQREVVERATVEMEPMLEAITLVAEPKTKSFADNFARFVPRGADSSDIRTKLMRAGIESKTAPQSYFLLRMLSLSVFPLLTWLIISNSTGPLFLLALGIGIFAGYIVPLALLDRMVRVRQEAITRSVPDALDLLVVCVEAGISLDAAILRVSRELRFLHGDLSYELATVSRLMNAGMSRERALRGLHERTGVQELRQIASSMIQSEKLGTSIATVLRVAAETLRRKRKQAAEKRAKQAPVKMIFPLMFFILPALFIVVLGPAIFVVIRELSKI